VGRVAARRRAPALSPLARAVTRFNASDAARTVAGLTRTLGAPRVSVGAAAGAPGRVRVTAAWELCWYQWTVDLDQPGEPVAAIAKGVEMSQLDGPARQWNARADARGRLALGARVPCPS
jgi:HAMP domain-containing protein